MPIEIKQVPFSTLINGTRPQDTPPNDVQAIRVYRIEEFEKYKSKKLIGSDIFTAESKDVKAKKEVNSPKPKETPPAVDIIPPKDIRLYEEEWRKTVGASNEKADAAQLSLFAENRKQHSAEESVEDARHNKEKVKHELYVLEDLVIEQELQSGSSDVIHNNLFDTATKPEEKRMDLNEKLTKLESDFDKRMIMRRRVDTFLTSMPGASVYSTSSSISSPRMNNHRSTMRPHRSIISSATSPTQSSSSTSSPAKKVSVAASPTIPQTVQTAADPVAPKTAQSPQPELKSPALESTINSSDPPSPASSPAISPIAIPKRPLAPTAPKPSRPSVLSPRTSRLSNMLTEEEVRVDSAESAARPVSDDSHTVLQEEARRLSVNMAPALASKLILAASLLSPEPAPAPVVAKKKHAREIQDFETTNTTKYFASPYKAVVRRHTVNSMINTDPITPHEYSSSLHHISNNKREAKRLEEQYLLSKKISTVGMTDEQLREMRRYDRQQKRKFGIPLDDELRVEEESMRSKQNDVIACTLQKRREILESHHVFDKAKYDGVINGIHMARKQEIMRDIMKRHRNKDLSNHEQASVDPMKTNNTSHVTIANLLASSTTSCSLSTGEPTVSLLGDARQSESYFKEVQHRMRQSEEVDLLLGKCRWLISIVTMLKKQEKKVISQTPQSCFMFLAILKRFLMLNFDYTKDIFFTILEACVPASDHAIPIVHETLQLLREKANIGPIEFHDYLLKNNIQPSTMLLKQVREAKKRLQRRNKILAMAVFSKRVKPTVRTAARLSVNQPQRLSLVHATSPRASIKKNLPRLSIRPTETDNEAEPQATPRPMKSMSQSFVIIQPSRGSAAAQESIQSIIIEEDDSEEEDDEHVFSDEEQPPSEEEEADSSEEASATPWGDISASADKKPIILPRTTSIALGSKPYFRGTSFDFIDEEENED